ncbi:MAG TPA: TRAM domain-containing protein, partial [Deltaproteobacteria bacterium]|nr:TRAM domain-containing protein [Deltaproteobacteria bacterium]
MFHINLHIDRLSFGGSGIGRYQGKVCFVPFSCPGDELEVRITSDKRSFCSAEIVDVITPSADRITPVCPLAGRCGGCHWQHVDYAQQCAEKRDIFADALWRGARVERAQIGELVPSSLQYGYRSRAQFKLHGRGEHLQIGFYRQGTHFVED